MFFALVFICTIHLNAQYVTSDFIPTSLISDGLNAPGRLAIDNHDNIYITDAIQKSIVKYDAQGNYIETLITELIPLSVAIKNQNKLFVADKNTGDIYKFQSNGTRELFYSGLSFPSSMVFGTDNLLYIVDSQLKKVIGLNHFGNLVKEFTYYEFTRPTGITFDPINDRIIVSEHGGIGESVQSCGGGCSICWGSTGPLTTIYIFDIDGNLISNFGCFGTDDGLFQRIQGITVGPDGNIYATDPYLGRVSVFDPDGNFITIFGQQGDGLGEFNLPMDIAFSSDNRIFISSMNKGAIDIYSNIQYLLPENTSESTLVNNDANSNKETIVVGNYKNLEAINIYPNPTSGEFTIKISPIHPITSNINIFIYNLTGQLIHSEVFNPNPEMSNTGSIHRTINIGNFTRGIYIININAENYSAHGKLVLKD